MTERHWIDQIPLRLKLGLVRYRDAGIPTGDALRALLTNDLERFVNYADPDTLRNLKHLIWWLHRFMPNHAWGTIPAVETWIKHKGKLAWTVKDIQSWDTKVRNELRELGRESEI